MDSANSLAAMRAASLQTLATSAPVNPGVSAAIFRAKSSLSRSDFNPPKCTLKMEARPCKMLCKIEEDATGKLQDRP